MQFPMLAVVLAVLGIGWYLIQRNKSGAGNTFSVSSAPATPVLAKYARDLTKMAQEKKLDPVIGREQEISRVIQILSRRTKNNPILIGEAGIGKTAIVEGLALAIKEKKVPPMLYNKRVLGLDLSGLLAGTKYRGEFEQRLKKIVDEIVSAKRVIVLFIDEIHMLAEAGEAEGAIDAADILKPLLARGDLQVIGATTREEYEKYIKKDKTLDRRLQPIFVAEPTPEMTVKILEGIKNVYEKYHQVKIQPAALKEAVKATAFITERTYPDKAIDAIDEACSKERLNFIGKKTTAWPEVSASDVRGVVTEWKRNR